MSAFRAQRPAVGRPRIGQARAGGESNPVRSGKNRVLRRQSFQPSQSSNAKAKPRNSHATCDGRAAQAGLRPASFAARMRAPRSRSCDSFPFSRLTSRNEKSRRGFPGRLHSELSVQFVFNRPSKCPARRFRPLGTNRDEGPSRRASTRADWYAAHRVDARDRP
jgi:hypothetical protein